MTLETDMTTLAGSAIVPKAGFGDSERHGQGFKVLSMFL